eukprot:TRINITY_DN3739_c2_g1_i1.p2 TRINITY_DN3739_c2_g1~~TRINITY_DN3739_c2_g1_i1.p2  ORF type:complete len:266 (+),score=53.92 TRINITY_DN3739_c2_g1_i1:1383-2180(+)
MSTASFKAYLTPSEDDIKKLLATKVHVGTKNLDSFMERYVHARRNDGVHILDLHMTYQKLMLAARVIVAVENPADVCVVSARPYGQRAILKFAQYTGAQYVAGRFTPGQLTNQVHDKFQQPRVLIASDPRMDHQPIKESGYVNIPVIAFCDSDSPAGNIDLAIPCNNRGKQAIGMMYWMLTREILRLRGTIVRSVPWDVKVDLFFYRDPEGVLKEEDEKPAVHAALPPATQDLFGADKVTYDKTDGTGTWADDTTWEGNQQWAES